MVLGRTNALPIVTHVTLGKVNIVAFHAQGWRLLKKLNVLHCSSAVAGTLERGQAPASAPRVALSPIELLPGLSTRIKKKRKLSPGRAPAT
jgi:hypothetical protein